MRFVCCQCTSFLPLTLLFPWLCSIKAWVRYAKFEMKDGGGPAAARAVYERAIEELGEDGNSVSEQERVRGRVERV